MKETGIIMSGNHPRLILDGSKTMTRRTWGLEIINLHPNSWHVVWNEGDLWAFSNEAEEEALTLKCPYGQVGDRLWVREPWYPAFRQAENNSGVIYYCDGKDFLPSITRKHNWGKGDCKWKSSLFMPRWASRILLEITDIRVERVREIKGSDILKEGYPPPIAYPEGYHFVATYDVNAEREWFKNLWDSLNAKRGYGWEINPWPWAITFKRINQRA